MTLPRGLSIQGIQRTLQRYPFLFALLLLIVLIAINHIFQPELLELRPLNGNLRVFLPLMLLAAGQTMVVLGGGIDLSAGAMVTLNNAVLVTLLTADSTGAQVALAAVGICAVGMIAGWLNGMAVAYLRLQPIVTTYAASFVFTGVALLILPRPGGDIPEAATRLYKSTPGNIPFALIMIGVLALAWLVLRSTRYMQYLLAIGSQSDAAYSTGIPVNRIRLSAYVWSGFFSGLAALALTLNTGSGSPRIGDSMTLDSIVAVVLGGTRLSGGRGGVLGSIMGVAILGVIRNIISFADVPSWSQTLVNALIILVALAAPGAISLIRQLRRQWSHRT